jgi:hypothetical protein
MGAATTIRGEDVGAGRMAEKTTGANQQAASLASRWCCAPGDACLAHVLTA